MHAGAPRLIGSRRHDPSSVGRAAHNDGLASVVWVVPLLDAGVEGCIGYLARPFLKMIREQRFSIVRFYNFLKVYASIFDFLQ